MTYGWHDFGGPIESPEAVARRLNVALGQVLKSNVVRGIARKGRNPFEAPLFDFFTAGLEVLVNSPETRRDAEGANQARSDVVSCFSMCRWSRTKEIYFVSDKLVEGLSGVKIPEETPSSALFLPTGLNVPAISFRFNGNVIVFYIMNDPASGNMRCSVAQHGPYGVNFVLGWNPDVEKNVREICVKSKEARKESAEFKPKTNATELATAKIEPLLLAILAYIKGDRDVVRQVHPGFKPNFDRSGIEKLRKKPIAFHSVGDDYARVIEHWEKEREQEYGEQGNGKGSEVRPHIRRAHAHYYHTKDGGVVHFLPPIPVKGADLKGYDPDKPTKVKVQ